MPEVTIVMPALNEADYLHDVLERITAQTFADFEVIVVVGPSSDGTAEIAQSYGLDVDHRVRMVEFGEALTPGALNAGLDAASGTYLVRIDAHSEPPADYVERLVEHLRTDKWAGVGGRKLAVAPTSSAEPIAAALNSRVGVGSSPYHFDGPPREVAHIPFGAYLVDDLRAINGWDPAFRRHQDFELDQRIAEHTGKPLLLDPSITIGWFTRSDLAGLWRQYLGYGEGKAQLLRQRPETVRPRQILPGLLAPGIVGAVALGLWHRIFLLVPLGYGAALLAARKMEEPSEPVTQSAHVAAAASVMHHGWGFGMWKHLFAQLTTRGDR